MQYPKLAFILITVFSLAGSSNLSAQTCRVKTASSINGNAVYTEVFEYDYVDEKPEFPGGSNNLVRYINSTREYPLEAYKAGIQGRVTCAFIVNTDGKISNISVIRGVESSLNQEAVRIISMMPDWSPGKIGRINVPVRVITSIPFRK